MTDRQGIEIDYCPTCRGVWLDRGELDKIIDRAAPSAPVRAEASRDDNRRDYNNDNRYRDDRYKDDRYRGKPYKKRESFLSDLFDF